MFRKDHPNIKQCRNCEGIFCIKCMEVFDGCKCVKEESKEEMEMKESEARESSDKISIYKVVSFLLPLTQ